LANAKVVEEMWLLVQHIADPISVVRENPFLWLLETLAFIAGL
jgi:hypothetical protein